MPELPDIEYIVKKITPAVSNRIIKEVSVKQPVVIRMIIPGAVTEILPGKHIISVQRHGPFLLFRMDTLDLVIHFMLEGRISIQYDKKSMKSTCLSIILDNGIFMHFSDRRLMMKIYVTEKNSYDKIPGFDTQGIDIMSNDFTLEYFLKCMEKKSCQVRVFLLDQSVLSAIGNAYADEILYNAGINPRKKIDDLDKKDKNGLFKSIRDVMQWGICEVEKANQPVEIKVRDHMKVRGHAGKPCIACSTIIRKIAVYGFDSYYCPGCQPVPENYFIQWK
ncbi:MAG: hypothetical protein JXB88_06840 [Spirochaetales bacterium]|nr:hypothetical protein [Spirochaetales bacterium]